MSPIIPFDDHNFFLTFLVTVLLQLSCFVIAWTCQFDKITGKSGTLCVIYSLKLNSDGEPEIDITKGDSFYSYT